MNLVTGATGHIGNVLVRHLLQRGQPVRALILPGEDCTPLDSLNVKIVTGDVLKPETLQMACQGVTHVYHLAGMISIMPGRNYWVEKINIEGTHNMVEAARNAGVKRFVYTSSIHALKRVPHGITVDEEIPFASTDAHSSYDHSKAIASLTVRAAIPRGLDTVIACPTGVIGPYDFRLSEVGRIILDCVKRHPQFYVDGAYDFVDVRDVAEGLIQVCERGRTGEIYILSGEQITVPNLIKTVRQITGKGFSMIKIPISLARFAAIFSPPFSRLFKIKPRFTTYSLDTLYSNSVISHNKATQELGYQPRSLADSLADTIQWFKQNYWFFSAKGEKKNIL